MAEKRFLYLERKLNEDHELKKEYVSFMREYESLGHMKKVNEFDQNDNVKYYIPHHAIRRPSSSSTKLRVVFDASAKSTNGKSLNNNMLVGATVQSDLFNIVLRFRKHQYAMTTDIMKMYRQVYIDHSQTCLQRILWRENSQYILNTFELATVTYGTASAPFLATRSIQQLAFDEATKFPLASQSLIHDTYVDDVVTGAATLSEAMQVQQQLRQLTKQGCFQLHKWCTNDDRLLDEIPIKEREITKTNEFQSGEYIKALVLRWQPQEDYFLFKTPEFDSKSKPTKRNILSKIAKLFDPLGLLSPIIVTAKLLMQALWKNNSDWDDNVPREIEQNWLLFRNNLNTITNIQLPRCVFAKDSVLKRVELHGFADASEKAYGACLYVRSIDMNDEIHVNLLCSKSRAAPLKIITLPHLELCAAHLLSKLVSSTIEAMQINFQEVVLWTDSTITLFWIATPPYKLKTFVANRVNEIQQYSVNGKWQHISTKNNPADIISRGTMPEQLINLTLWWKGPLILKLKEIIAENQNLTLLDVDLELKPEKSIVALNMLKDVTNKKSIITSIFNRFRSYKRLIRVTTLCICFANKCRRIRNYNNELTVLELDAALIILIKVIQMSVFEAEIKSLSSNKECPNNSKLKGLNPFLDKTNVLRVGGRLRHVDIDYDTKHQILLPSNHEFVKLLFENEHKKQHHAGPQLLLSLIRRKFWPIAGKNMAKKIVRNCVICARTQPTVVKQIMGDLPQQRVAQTKPFLNTGVDYCGPFFIRHNFNRRASPSKIYVASFVCFSTKAMHLEVVSDLTSQSFIACLKRFLARRGRVENIWSDNATNFIGANRELKQLFKQFISQTEQGKISSFCANEQINWHFIPPRAPNFGGLWEASIKSFKFHLKRVTKGNVLTLEEFETLTIQIEGILNSRPLTCLSDDPNDPESLTPNHFLTGGPSMTISETSVLDITNNRLTKWQRITKMKESFWKRYSIEYLHTLQARLKWKREIPNLKINDIVMLVEENIPSIKWPLGKIVSVIQGKDNKVRVIEVRTQAGIFKRSVSKVVKLPIDCEL